MHTEQCGYCRKWVSHKPLLGTLHFCLTEAERRRANWARGIAQQQQHMMRDIERNGSPYTRGFDALWGHPPRA